MRGALARYDDRERTRFWAARVGEDAGVTHRCYLALTLWHLGYADQALKLSCEACELARAIDHPFSLAYAQHHASWLRQLMRLGDETVKSGQEQIRYSAERGFPLFHATGLVYAAAGGLLQGETERSLLELVAGLDAYRATGAALALPHYLGILGEALTKSGRGSGAGGLLNHALGRWWNEVTSVAMKPSCTAWGGELAWREGREPAEVEERLFLRAMGCRQGTTKQGVGASSHDEPCAAV